MKNLLFIIICVFLSSCNIFDTSPEDEVKPEDIEDLAEMNRSFAWDIFKEEIDAEQTKNVLISPLSIQTALSMALNGANGMTLEEMQEVLHCNPCDLSALNIQQQKLILSLTKQSGHPEIRMANAYFYD
ncbi:MAG TPA: serpin family protein, partial [Saprospiraceae bacterium]|nr:serpin family protein [Saprospiraceae bacterium]